jgi:hypothetical protein
MPGSPLEMASRMLANSGHALLARRDAVPVLRRRWRLTDAEVLDRLHTRLGAGTLEIGYWIGVANTRGPGSDALRYLAPYLTGFTTAA